MKKLIIISLFLFGWSPLSAASTNYSFVTSLTYLNVPAGNYGYGLGALIESSLFADSELGVGALGLESGVVYFKRTLQAGSSRLGFYSFHIPLLLKLHINPTYSIGVGYYADVSDENRSLFYGPKIAFGILSPATNGFLGLHFSDWSYELQYLIDQAQSGTFDTLVFLFGFRY